MGDKRVGPGRSVNTGRFNGRFVYTEHDDGVSVGGERYKKFLVNRISDGRYLGIVRHKLGTSWWYAQPRDEAGPAPDRQARREWAADELDANSRKHEWCACGNSVPTHDRPTRAAMRAWAGASDPNRDVGAARDAVSWQAAWHARYRGRHYDLTRCVTHAAAYAGPVTDGHMILVKPDLAPLTWVMACPDAIDGGYVLQHRIGAETTEQYLYPGEAPTLELIRDRYRKRGYVEVYDWRK